MDQSDKKPVEQKADEHAGDQPGVEKKEGTSAPVPADPESLEILQSALVTIDRLIGERDNYKNVALAKKRGTPAPAEPESEEDVEARAQQIADAKIRDQQIKKERDDLAERIRINKENRELRTTIRNRNGVNNAPTGASGPDSTPTPAGSSFFSESQLKALGEMQRNMPKGVVLDPKKIEQMHKQRMGIR